MLILFVDREKKKKQTLTIFPRRTHRSQGRPSLQLRFAATQTLQALLTYFRRFVRGPSAGGFVSELFAGIVLFHGVNRVELSGKDSRNRRKI